MTNTSTREWNRRTDIINGIAWEFTWYTFTGDAVPCDHELNVDVDSSVAEIEVILSHEGLAVSFSGTYGTDPWHRCQNNSGLIPRQVIETLFDIATNRPSSPIV